MNEPKRPKRFVVIPSREAEGRDDAMLASSANRVPMGGPSRSVGPNATKRVVRGAGSGPRTTSPGTRIAGKVVNQSPADGALLIEPREHLTLDQLRAQMPPGTKVLEEQWYRLERPARPWGKLSTDLRKPRVRAGNEATWTVTVVLADGSKRLRLADASVTVMIDEDKAIGVEGRTNRRGKATFSVSSKLQRVDAIYVEPLHSGWPVAVKEVLVDPGGVEIAVVPIDRSVADARGLVYGKAKAAAGKKINVAVVDTGVGAHDALEVTRGRNTTTEPARRFRDEDGHGSHVAGVIAATAAGWRRGEASGVALHAYRIFEAGDAYASTFAIAAAIKDAAERGCDLVNLSIGDSMADEGVRDAVEFAWSRGCVCVAATGNDGKGRIDYPARYDKTIAVSAIGLAGGWPVGADLDWTISASRGKPLGGHGSFLASFSNRGAKVALTAPGVGIVSTIFGNRWGVMSGTSMATPIATGVLARRMAATPAVRDLPRNEARSAAIVTMATGAAEDLHLPAGMQGKGLAR